MKNHFLRWKTGVVTISQVDEAGIVQNCIVLSDGDMKELIADTHNEAVQLLGHLIDDNDCRFDHQGFCQAHWGLGENGVCKMYQAKLFLGVVME